MVQVNDKKQEITITIQGGVDELRHMQNSIINLMKYYNFEEYGMQAGDTFHFANNLLDAMMPEPAQLKTGVETKEK